MRRPGRGLLLDTLATLLGCGDAAGALALWPATARFGPSARRSGLLGHLDILCGRGSMVEAHLLEARQAYDPDTEPLVGAAAATSLAAYLCTVRRVQEALSWGERAVAAGAGDPAARMRALTMVAVSLTLTGRGPEGLARLSGLPDVSPQPPEPAPSWPGPAVTCQECCPPPHPQGPWAGTRSLASPPAGAPWSSKP